MGYNTKNYTEQGGEKTVIGGELCITPEGKVLFGEAEVAVAKYQSDSDATTIAGLKDDLNKLIAKLKASGWMLSEAPVITLIAQTDTLQVTEGDISELLFVEADVTGGALLQYQWYSNSVAENNGGDLIAEATDELFAIPTELTEGTYYYYCVISADEAESVTSDVVTVTVEQGS